jgi:hypothetical protein
MYKILPSEPVRYLFFYQSFKFQNLTAKSLVHTNFYPTYAQVLDLKLLFHAPSIHYFLTHINRYLKQNLRVL